MLSFREVAYNFQKPMADLNANAVTAGLGTMNPIVDLHAQKEITKTDLDQLERYADKLFAAVGIDVEFTRHFLDRVNDERNKKQITTAELTRLFKQSFKKYGKKIAQLGPDAEAVINDMRTDVNMPFALNLKGGELELVAKTIMRKKDFKTRNTKLAFEQYRMLEAPRIPRKKGQPAGSDKHSDLYTDENPKGTIHGLKFATVDDAKASVAKIEKSGKTHAHKIQIFHNTHSTTHSTTHTTHNTTHTHTQNTDNSASVCQIPTDFSRPMDGVCVMCVCVCVCVFVCV